MRVEIVSSLRETAAGATAEAVIGACVHCGMCNSACPTYRLTGDELDGPRGRIYLMKQAMEGGHASRLTQHHLDRCLSCRACETACPSGGRDIYRLLDVGRSVKLIRKVKRPSTSELAGSWSVFWLPDRPAIGLFAVGRLFQPMLPRSFTKRLPPANRPGAWPRASHERRMLTLGGCVQKAAATGFNSATARVFDHLGV